MAQQTRLRDSSAAVRFGMSAGVVGLGLSLALVLSGCTADKPVATTPPTSAPTVDPAAPPPVLAPEGDAAANLPYFDLLGTTVLAATPDADGRTIVDAIVAGGFTKTDMEVTFDRTNVDLAVDTLQWSVRWKDECLIGQTGPASDGYHSMVAKQLETGTCLLGATRPIDW